MPTYEHQCQNPECKYEWEEDYSIKDDPPELCPHCHQKTVKRLISLGGKGVVELYGQDLVDKSKADTAQLQKEAAANENVYANLLGEDKYHDLQTRMDRRPRRR
jgi:putative FmdB family regulatory protein